MAPAMGSQVLGRSRSQRCHCQWGLAPGGCHVAPVAVTLPPTCATPATTGSWVMTTLSSPCATAPPPHRHPTTTITAGIRSRRPSLILKPFPSLPRVPEQRSHAGRGPSPPVTDKTVGYQVLTRAGRRRGAMRSRTSSSTQPSTVHRTGLRSPSTTSGTSRTSAAKRRISSTRASRSSGGLPR